MRPLAFLCPGTLAGTLDALFIVAANEKLNLRIKKSFAANDNRRSPGP